MDMISEISRRLETIKERMASACQRSGRDVRSARLVGVSKTQPVKLVQAAVEAGLGIVGENYVQEAQARIEALGHGVEWHFIGRLQSNKAKYAVRMFDLIHSVDNLKLARELSRRAGESDIIQPVLVEINIAGEESKGGVSPDEAERLIHEVGELPHLELRGLMTMPPFFDQPEKVRPFFAELRRLAERIGPPLKELSMGMSGDFEVAIEEGATLVRVGTALFGPRR
jgi:pyridoxal phosphate enzyme (YggS family)